MGFLMSGVTVWCDIADLSCVEDQHLTKNALGSQAKNGRGGIRTHGEFNPTYDFESYALNRTRPPFLEEGGR